ncbi:MAG TPA: cytochrome c [Terriglobales bacterium]
MHKLLRFVTAGVFLAGCWLPAQNPAVTDVEGESWLDHLARSFNETSMGKTGRLGPAPNLTGEESESSESELSLLLTPNTVTLHGADLYRLNCQGCHGESGLGAPPEINSVINPVRATSVALVMDRMKKVGMDVSSASADEMAKQSRKALLLRLHKGGEDMPPFLHLNEPEIRALMGYLNQLAGVSGVAGEHITLTESRERIGEHIAKSTCHICHAATGSNPSPEEIMEGAIPPLSTLTARKNLPQFVRKVTQGAPVSMGTPPSLCRGRMPVFGYLSEGEAADVYLYLTLHPPRGSATAAAAVTSNPQMPPNGASINDHLPVAPDRENPQPVSLAKFAFFPAVLFLFLGTLVMKCLPMAATAHHTHGNECAPCAAGIGGAAATTVGPGKKQLALTVRESVRSRDAAGASPSATMGVLCRDSKG